MLKPFEFIQILQPNDIKQEKQPHKRLLFLVAETGFYYGLYTCLSF